MNTRFRRRMNPSYPALLCAVSAAIGGCHRIAPTDRAATATLRYATEEEPMSLDPAVSNSAENSDILQNIYEGLTRLDEHLQPVPCLAQGWEISKDGITYTFHLNPQAKFHAPFSRPVTAADIKYSYERALLPETKAPTYPELLAVLVGARDMMAGKRKDCPGIVVVDAHTVRLTFTKPASYFLTEGARVAIVCREAVEKSSGVFDIHASIGTGPFRLADYQHGVIVALEANPDYYGGAPKLRRIEKPIVTQAQTERSKYQVGDLDIARVFPSDYDTMRNDPALKNELRVAAFSNIYFVGFNQNAAPVLRDLRVRQAILQAIDRDSLRRVATKGLSEPLDGYLPPMLTVGEPKIAILPYNPEAARQKLAAAGFPGGKGFPTLAFSYVATNPVAAACVQIVASDLQKNLGISVQLNDREAGSYFRDVRAGKLGLFCNGWAAPDAYGYLDLLLHSGAASNFFAFSDAAFDRQCDAADREQDDRKRAVLYAQANQRAVDQCAVIPIFAQQRAWLVKPTVHALTIYGLGFMPHRATYLAK